MSANKKIVGALFGLWLTFTFAYLYFVVAERLADESDKAVLENCAPKAEIGDIAKIDATKSVERGNAKSEKIELRDFLLLCGVMLLTMLFFTAFLLAFLEKSRK
jgi:hypothetical protein